jgi:hypothetical protein
MEIEGEVEQSSGGAMDYRKTEKCLGAKTARLMCNQEKNGRRSLSSSSATEGRSGNGRRKKNKKKEKKQKKKKWEEKNKRKRRK